MNIEYGYLDEDDVWHIDGGYFGDLPSDTKEPIICPQCWDDNEYDGDKIAEITKQMCKGIR